MADASGSRRDTLHFVNLPQPNLQIKTFFNLDKVLLIRFTIDHNEPVKRKEINSWLKPDAVKEFQGFLSGHS
ncbi:MAG: hypothetical protein AN481_15810 [Aphanizomenon flos-aquae LD13]|uniref:Uncharacterized protein n=1 Tax=Aphanizomenon flos-aquae LD13 TaxID=1710894 RepID=A0A1B7VPB2_APHFL|nr:MAG: hypothetical protein AN481_15810 [Aphanizomenon flos-aquae LD13]HCQ21976.1 hypothetical protein [Anabaena sp. UBA12330]